jgi:3-hydroxyacyl-[acyl-carrier-protein] dehydratase
MGTTDNLTSLPLLQHVISKVQFDDQRREVVAELCCPADFPAFAGHFPGQPVLPAVIQLAVIRSLTGDLLARPLEPVRTRRLKFKGMVGPGDLVQVRVEIKKEEDNWLASFKLAHDGKAVSSGAIIFRERA